MRFLAFLTCTIDIFYAHWYDFAKDEFQIKSSNIERIGTVFAISITLFSNHLEWNSSYTSIFLGQRSCSWLHIHRALPFIRDLWNYPVHWPPTAGSLTPTCSELLFLITKPSSLKMIWIWDYQSIMGPFLYSSFCTIKWLQCIRWKKVNEVRHRCTSAKILKKSFTSAQVII